METQVQKQIINKNFDLMFIKFPIIFPIIYGLVRTPVLTDRHIIFVLIPIIILISVLIFVGLVHY